MKRILITGEHGYIGTVFRLYMGFFPEEYAVERISLRNGDAWRAADFSPYDAILHTAGLVHTKETEENRPLFYKLNRDLTRSVAEKAKTEGVGQFIFLSTMAVYGLEEGVITRDTAPAPKTAYGQSKLEAEEALRGLEDRDFRAAILRIPMVYGPRCPGNYRTLVELSKILPAVPDYGNQRSVLRADRLAKYLKGLVDAGGYGLFFPQDPQYMNTCREIQRLAREAGREIPRVCALNAGPALLRKCTDRGRKAFGTLIYRDL